MKMLICWQGNGLSAIDKFTPHEARERIINLEERHKSRRSLVWAEIGEAPLVQSLEYLAKIAELTKRGLNAGTTGDLEKLYLDFGWEIDCSLLKSLKTIETVQDLNPVSTALRIIYYPGWKIQPDICKA
jgi:hypothetical protein